MFRVELLPGGYGDALLVEWGSEREPSRMLVDGGLASSFPAVAKRLRALTGPVDLLVVTHVDRDHISGVLKLLADDRLASLFRAVWFNGREQVEQASDLLGVLDGEALGELIVRRGIPWNPGWPGRPGRTVGPVMVGDHPPTIDLKGATITLLSPTTASLGALWPVWRDAIRKAGLTRRPSVPEPQEQRGRPFLGLPTLSDLAAISSDPDTSEANGSSIAFVFSYEGQSVLFGADAHAKVLLESLRQLTPPGERLRLQACKLPHHGSRRNVSAALVRALDCAHWWFSSSGVRFHHPNRESVARVLEHGRRPAVLSGNYASQEWATFLRDYPPEDHGYEVRLPPRGAPGMAITLA